MLPEEIESADTEDESLEPSEDLTVEMILHEDKNLLDLLDQDEINRIQRQCIDGYGIDMTSRDTWFQNKEDAIKLAKQIQEEKTYPWPDASNVKYPLLTVACLQFNARAYPAIVSGKNIAKATVNGADPAGEKKAKADRISRHLSWQILFDIPGWEENMDKLLIYIPCVGMAFKKTYYCPTSKKNRSDFVLADNVVFNYDVKDFNNCNRITHVFKLYPNEILERQRAGIFTKFDLYPETDGTNDEENKEKRSHDDDGPHVFLEQHTWFDLDEDGYKEPYVITLHKDTGKAVRMMPRYTPIDVERNEEGEIIRINAINYFTKYGFIPNPDGSAHDIGFGDILMPINETVNTTLNMMMDAGTLQNVGGGFIGSGVRMPGGPIRRRLGEYIQVGAPGTELRSNLVEINHPGPSPALFNLLGMLIEAGKDISSVKDIMTGQQAVSNTPASTTLALIEQGMKTFTAIFKRIHRSFGEELRKLSKLNGIYLDPKRYFTFQDMQQQVLQDDYQDSDLDVTPVADPSVVSDVQKMAIAEALMPFAQDPDFNPQAIKQRYLEALGVDDIPSIMATPEQQQQKAMAGQQQMAVMQEQIATQRKEIEARIRNLDAKSIQTLADAESKEVGSQMEQYRLFLDQLIQWENTIDKINAGGMGRANEQQGVQKVQALPAGVQRLPTGANRQ